MLVIVERRARRGRRKVDGRVIVVVEDWKRERRIERASSEAMADRMRDLVLR